MRTLSLLLLLTLSLPARAVELAGYVVKADSATVFLDLGAASGVALGQNFVVFKEGEELRHPITGASLGRVESQLARGHIAQIQEKFSVGAFERVKPEFKIEPGQKIRMLATFTQSAVPQPVLAAYAPAPVQQAAPAAQQAAVQQLPALPSQPPSYLSGIAAAISGTGAPAAPNPGDRAPVWRSPPMDMEAVGLALGDVDGDGRPEILFADGKHVYAYPQSGDWKPVAQFENTITGSRILSIEAVDLNKNGRTEVFVTFHNALFERVETVILELKDKSFEKLATVPYMIRYFQEADGTPQLGAQQLVDDATFPYGSIYTLAYKDGKYATDKPVKAKRLEWLYGFTLAKDPAGETFPIYVTPTDRIRAQFKKGAWLSQESFYQTPNKLVWKGRDNAFRFRTRLLGVREKGDLRGIYAIENNAALGSLGSAFSFFNDGKLDFLVWDGLALRRGWTTGSLGGYATDLAMVSDANGQPQELWVAVMGSNGRSVVEKFQP